MRLIDADSLEWTLKEIVPMAMWSSNAILDLVRQEKTISDPDKHGYWLCDTKHDIIHCSECGNLFSEGCSAMALADDYKFCPACGAKMDGTHKLSNERR